MGLEKGEKWRYWARIFDVGAKYKMKKNGFFVRVLFFSTFNNIIIFKPVFFFVYSLFSLGIWIGKRVIGLMALEQIEAELLKKTIIALE